MKTKFKIQSQNKISKITNQNEIAFVKAQKYLIFMPLVSCNSFLPAIDQLLTLKLKLSNSHALKTIGKPLPIATRLSTFLQDGDGTTKKCTPLYSISTKQKFSGKNCIRQNDHKTL